MAESELLINLRAYLLRITKSPIASANEPMAGKDKEKHYRSFQ
jgi:hypothetical protein